MLTSTLIFNMKYLFCVDGISSKSWDNRRPSVNITVIPSEPNWSGSDLDRLFIIKRVNQSPS